MVENPEVSFGISTLYWTEGTATSVNLGQRKELQIVSKGNSEDQTIQTSARLLSECRSFLGVYR